MLWLLQSHIPQRHIEFLQSLPLYLSFDGYFLVHGGIDPRKPLDSQTRHDFLWTRPDQYGETIAVPKTVVHGHTPVEVAQQVGWRIPIDTGAFFSGVLSAAKLRPDLPPKFISVAD